MMLMILLKENFNNEIDYYVCKLKRSIFGFGKIKWKFSVIEEFDYYFDKEGKLVKGKYEVKQQKIVLY